MSNNLIDKCIDHILSSNYNIEIIDSIITIQHYDETCDLTEYLDLFKNKDGYNASYARFIGNSLCAHTIKPLSEFEYNILINRLLKKKHRILELNNNSILIFLNNEFIFNILLCSKSKENQVSPEWRN